MQKWCPDPFDVGTPRGGSAVVDPAAFEPAGPVVVADDAGLCGFRREAGFADTRSLMNSLTKEERAQVYELVEIDLIEEYKQREADISREFETRLADAKADFGEMFNTWTENVARVLASELKEAAAASSRLAVQVAGKIVRTSVEVDPEILARVIETTLFKIASHEPLVVVTNPVDAAWLSGQDGLLERLGIGSVVGDRRVERGGCVIKCEGREWDATLTSQLDTIGDLIAEAIATSEADPAVFGTASRVDPAGPENDGEDSDEPGVE